jgi:alpha-ketoglutaric semialdehyde dehydrogenase
MTHTHPDHLLNYIDGSWKPSASGRVRTNLNPANTDDIIGEFSESVAADVTAAIDAAVAAQPAWDAVGPVACAEALSRARRLVDERLDDFAAAIR